LGVLYRLQESVSITRTTQESEKLPYTRGVTLNERVKAEAR